MVNLTINDEQVSGVSLSPFIIENKKLSKINYGSYPREGNYITTSTGRNFYPLDIREGDIHENDIKSGLCNSGRWTGQLPEGFYSVAQHVCMCAALAPKEFAWEAFHHDDSEAYISDISRPLKHILTEYSRIEKYVESKIAEHFNIPFPMSPEVKLVDNRMLVTEARFFYSTVSGYLRPIYYDDPFSFGKEEFIKIDKWWEESHWPEPYDYQLKMLSPEEIKPIYTEMSFALKQKDWIKINKLFTKMIVLD